MNVKKNQTNITICYLNPTLATCLEAVCSEVAGVLCISKCSLELLQSKQTLLMQFDKLNLMFQLPPGSF